MKQRIYLMIMLAAMTLSSMAQIIGEEMYIYRSNGQVNGFLPNEVLSIEYSDMDAEGNRYDEIVTQVVNTADSVYMIPLAEIDSVSFVTPQMEYKPGVINLSDQLMPYVVSSTDFSITFNSITPGSIMPRVGDKLVTLEMNDKFPVGFIGEVTAVSGTQVTCCKVSLEEVFDSYHAVSSTYGYQEGSQTPQYARRRASSFGNKDFKLGTFTWSKSTELSSKLFGSDNLAMKGGTQLSIGITPSFHVVSTLIVNKEEGTYFSASITGDITLKESVAVYGGIDWSKDFLDKEWVKAPVAPLTFFYVKPGLFFRASATVSTTATWTQHFTMGAAFDFSSKKRSVIKPKCGGRLVSSAFDLEGSIDGSMAIGGFMEVGLTVASSDIDKLCFRGELGAELVGQAVLYNADIESTSRETKVYERFKNSNIAVNAFVSTAVEAECGPWGISYSLPWNLSYNIRTWNLVPTFSNTTFKQKMNPQISADASTNMSGDCLIPVQVGLSVRDENGAEVNSHYAQEKFAKGNKTLSHTFTNLSSGDDYTLYPKVRIFGYEMLASPSAELNKTEMPVKITNFKQTASHYEKDAYTNNGINYSYKYDCAVTVELAKSENVEDWGYVYENPNGKIARISLRSFDSPYTDTRYSYYRNEASSTVRLYEYVKFAGDNEYYYGEPKDYQVSHKGKASCPDSNHPHWIDLGLPSGTLWRCCNQGASTPEGYGDYYAFGAVASAPSFDQIIELVSNTTYMWTSLDGVQGGKFTGHNGSTIFLPAAGFFSYGDFIGAGSIGGYWSSTREKDDIAWGMYVNSSRPDLYGSNGRGTRDNVQSVRPVR